MAYKNNYLSVSRAGKAGCRKLQFKVAFFESIDLIENEFAVSTTHSRQFATFKAAKRFAETMPGTVELRVGSLGIGYATSRAGFSKRGPCFLTPEERDMLTSAGFAVTAISRTFPSIAAARIALRK